MSLIEQASELVKGVVSAEAEADRPATLASYAVAEETLDLRDAERIRQEWDAQPHHP